MSDVVTAFSQIFQPLTLLVILGAAAYGGFIGATPGLTATMATALFIPFAYFMDPVPALAAVATLSAVAIFAGDVPAALVRMPGVPASAAYLDDLYKLTQSGRGGVALGVCILASVIGGVFGTVLVIAASPVLSAVAMNFTSFEYFWLAVLGLGSAVVIAQDSPLKGALSVLFGLLLATVGIDVTLGFPRFSFGISDLLAGVGFIPAMIGLFGVSQLIVTATTKELRHSSGTITATGMFSEAWRAIRKYWFHAARSIPLGALIGALPGAGADIASWIAYALGKNTSKNPETFGQGTLEPLVAASSANNSSMAAAYVPALFFGIPGDSITAIVVGVLYMKGIRPGPNIFIEQRALIYSIYLAFLLAALLILPIGYIMVRNGAWILRTPKNVLVPVILAFSIVGSFAINNSLFDVGVMLVFGLVGYLFQRYDIPLAPIVLGLILGPIVEQNFMVSVAKTNWNLLPFLNRPISAALMVFAVLTWSWPLLRRVFHTSGNKG